MSVSGVEPSGLIVISDCIRPEARGTFEYFASQNVDIKVISGDNPVTVSNIAVKAGLEGGERYIDANTLPEDFEELREVVPNYTVYGLSLIHIFSVDKENGTVVFATNHFSKYVLVQKDAVVEDETGETTKETVKETTKKESTKVIDTPKTGDSATVGLYTALLIISALGIAAVVLLRKKI